MWMWVHRTTGYCYSRLSGEHDKHECTGKIRVQLDDVGVNEMRRLRADPATIPPAEDDNDRQEHEPHAENAVISGDQVIRL